MPPLANDAIEEWVEAVVGAGKNPPGVSISIISECQVIELKLEKIGFVDSCFGKIYFRRISGGWDVQQFLESEVCNLSTFLVNPPPYLFHDVQIKPRTKYKFMLFPKEIASVTFRAMLGDHIF